MAIEKHAFGISRRIARRRAAPALHPHGVTCVGVLDVPGGEEPGGPWGVPFLDRPGLYDVTVRWSRAAGLPRGLPDALGLALRVEDAGGRGAPLDLLLTSSGSSRLGRHVPRPRYDALAGPYSTLLSYRVGGQERVIAAFPADARRSLQGDLAALRQELGREPVSFELRAAGGGEPWRAFATLTAESPQPYPERTTPTYDPYTHSLPGLRPTDRLRGLRAASYSGSRHGRTDTPA
ncbi:phosphodiesterase [Streptomyces ficellus]|uniref:Phosphodiesterase n=1 Tax=Streptomyces ficellus TaxID=1977088 RepID=A0ABT7ZEQ3_9ACTN|nr:phosphodiesterase [Streptomyces ficellus]MDN3297901.1 phosphodiesterase [Streptomyces ficellus]